MVVLICLIFSVLSTIDGYQDFANETLFVMVSFISPRFLLFNIRFNLWVPKGFYPSRKIQAPWGLKGVERESEKKMSTKRRARIP